jgi:long-subunit acyl-CoA synthetase (AMP-forming)
LLGLCKGDQVAIMMPNLLHIRCACGTTGVAEGAVLTHGNLIANVQQMTAWLARDLLEGKEVFVCPLPLLSHLNRAMAGDVDDCLDLEATHHFHCGQTEDHREAARAFVEKREPVFKGR